MIVLSCLSAAENIKPSTFEGCCRYARGTEDEFRKIDCLLEQDIVHEPFVITRSDDESSDSDSDSDV